MKYAVPTVALFLGGCIIDTTPVRTAAETPKPILERLERTTQAYVSEAKNKAAFNSECDASEAQAQIVSRRPSTVLVKDERGNLVRVSDYPLPTSVGVTLCGDRALFAIECRADILNRVNWVDGPCVVVAEGSDAHTAVRSKYNAEQQQEREAMRQLSEIR